VQGFDKLSPNGYWDDLDCRVASLLAMTNNWKTTQ
jgi:hypothetical protein